MLRPRRKTAGAITQLWFSYFTTSSFKARSIHFSREAKERDTLAVNAFTPVSLFVYDDDHPSLSIFRRLCRTSSQRTPFGFTILSISGRISSQPADFPTSEFWQFRGHRLQLLYFSPPNAPRVSGVVTVAAVQMIYEILSPSAHVDRPTAE